MLDVRIYYEDTDAGGVVYYANYLKYFERARTEHLRKMGIEIKDMLKRGITFIVVRTEIDYKSPARLGDVLQVETGIKDVSKASFWVDYIIRRKEDEKIIVIGRTRMSCVNNDGKPIRLPEDVIKKMQC